MRCFCDHFGRRQSLFGKSVPHLEIRPGLSGPLENPAVHVGKGADLVLQHRAVFDSSFQSDPEEFASDQQAFRR